MLNDDDIHNKKESLFQYTYPGISLFGEKKCGKFQHVFHIQ